MADLAALQFSVQTTDVVQAEGRLRALETTTKKVARATDDFAASQRRTGAATDDLTRDAMKQLAIMREHEDAMRHVAMATEAATVQQNRLHAAQMASATSAKVAGRAGLDLGRQLSDVGVQAAMGTSALMILVMQGPQIADSLSQATKAGVGLTGVLGGMVGGLAPLVATLAPLITVVGGATAGFALFHRELSKDFPRDLTDGLGLTAEQLKEVKNRTVTLGDTFGATFTVMGRHLMSGPLGDAVNGFKTFMSDAFDRIARGAINVSANIAGVIAVAGRLAGVATDAFKGDWDKIAAGATTSLSETFNNAAGRVRTGAAGFGAEVGAEARTRATARIMKEAGDAAKAAKPDIDKATDTLKRLREEFEALQTSYMSPEEQAMKRYTDDLKALQEQLAGKAITKPEAWEAAQQALAALHKTMATPLKAAEGFDLSGLTNGAAAASKTLTDGFEQAARDSHSAVRSITGAVDDVFYSIRDHDWGSAFGGLLNAIGTVKSSWGDLSGAGKISAISNIAGAAGAAVGGAAGAGLMGAAGGAMGGASLALSLGLASNPAGWVIAGTAAIGGLLGLFGDAKAKKRERAEQAARAAADAAALALERANQFRDIEIQKLTLLGESGAARALQLEAERAGIAAENLAAFDELQGLKEAAGLRELNIQLMEADGRTSEALAMRQHDALVLLTPAQQELTKQIWAAVEATNARTVAEAAAEQARAIAKATFEDQLRQADEAINKARSDLAAAENAEAQRQRADLQATANAAQSARDRLLGFRDGLIEFDRSLTDSMSGLAGGYRASAGAFYSNAKRAQLGDADAQGQFVALGRAYAEAAKQNAPTQLDYLRDLAGIRSATEAARLAAGRQINVQQAQLDAAHGQLSALEAIREGVMSMAQAQANLAAALGAKAALTGIANDNGGSGPPQGSIYDSATDSWLASTVTKSDLDRAQAAGIGMAFDRFDPGATAGLINSYRAGHLNYLVDGDGNPTGVAGQLKAAGFAAGGMHQGGLRIVGEEGPELEATGPARIWSATQTSAMLGGGSGDVVDAIEGLRQELSAVRSELAEIKNNTKDTAKATKGTDYTLMKVSLGGSAIRTEAA